MNENFLPNVVNVPISGETINLYLTHNCDIDTILRVKAVEEAVKHLSGKNPRNAADFQEHFEKIYNFLTNE